jgi:hypothetical protein
MNLYTDNTHELVKVFFLSDFLAMSTRDYIRTMDRFHSGRYDLIVIDDMNP